MKSFTPENNLVFILIICLLGLIILGGFGLASMRNYKVSINFSWIFLAIVIVFAERLTRDEPPGFRMLAIILATLFAMKIPVTIEAYKNRNMPLGFIQWVAFTVGWFGMRPTLFERLGNEKLPGARQLIFFGISRIIIGGLLLATAIWIAENSNEYYQKIIFSGLLLAGLSFILHFGILNVSAGMWRLSGVDTKTLFRSPLLSTSLSEFWGRRWNIAFSEMTSIAIYRPLKFRLGVSIATIIAFLFSGLLHELAISVPVKSGYGLPMLYFLIHGFLMIIEKSLEKRGFSISTNKVMGRAWVIFWLILPLPILFHKAFIKEVLWPIIGQ